MKTKSLLLVTVTIISSILGAPSDAFTRSLVVTAEKANVRSGPSGSAPKVGQASRGLVVREISQVDGWSQVEIETPDGVVTGWISSELMVRAIQPPPPMANVYETDFGKVVERKEGFGRWKIFVNDVEFVYPEDRSPPSIERQFGNNFLIIELGGAFCPALLTWLIIDEAGPRLTDNFGPCSDLYTIAETPDGIDLIMGSSRGETETWRFNGENVEQVAREKNVVTVENSMDPKSWIGKTAFDYLSSSATENYLLSLMTMDELLKLTRSSNASVQSFKEDGDWIVAVGRFEFLAMARAEDNNRVLVALSKKTNEVFIHSYYRNNDGSTTTEKWGVQPTNLTSTMRMAMSR